MTPTATTEKLLYPCPFSCGQHFPTFEDADAHADREHHDELKTMADSLMARLNRGVTPQEKSSLGLHAGRWNHEYYFIAVPLNTRIAPIQEAFRMGYLGNGEHKGLLLKKRIR